MLSTNKKKLLFTVNIHFYNYKKLLNNKSNNFFNKNQR